MTANYHMNQAWREFEAYAVPVTEEGMKSMQRRYNQFRAGWEAAIKNHVNLLMIQHEAAKDRHNYFKVAANLIQAEVASDT
jgi:hypothetical protein